MNDENKDQYYIGLDIGTDSCGWATSDQNYNIIKKNGKHLWGVRLFDCAETAQERRTFRCNRRRLERRRERIELLQSLFAEEISKIDSEFFLRLNESALYDGDKTVSGDYSLFNDIGYTDKEYNKKYKSIFHLEQSLIHNKEKVDLRLIYLACHHLCKYRGNFLMNNYSPQNNIGNDMEIKETFNKIADKVNFYYGETIETISFNDIDLKQINDIYKNNEGISYIESKLNELINPEKNKIKKVIIKFLSGGIAKVSSLFGTEDIDYSSLEKESFSIKDEMIDEYIAQCNDISEIGESAYILSDIKTIYDYFLLNKLLKGNKYIADAMVIKYEEHKNDLRLLKNFIKDNYSKETYYNLFRSNNEENNYARYIGSNITNNNKKTFGSNKTNKNEKACSYEDFLKYLKKVLESNQDVKSDDYNYILNKINNQTFLKKLRSKDLVYIPYQLTKQELTIILKNASLYYPFLLEKDEDNLSISDKIISILEFKVPYYVGPLNYNNGKTFAWIVKRSNQKITPWNFNQVVDLEASSEKFIKRMTNKCSYYLGKDVLPKKSLLYSEFMLLNEINTIQINGQRISIDVKIKLINDVFKNNKKVSLKYLKKYFAYHGYGDNVEISGIDGEIKNNLSSYIDFKNILGHDLSFEEYIMAEKIIFWITIFNDSAMIYKKVKEEYHELLNEDESIYKKIKGLTYKGWGRLSKEFLQDLVSDPDQYGECKCIIDIMRETNENLNEALYDKKYKLDIKLKSINALYMNNDVTYKNVEELYCSPSVKRGVWQSLKLVDEIIKIQHKKPSMIFVEVTRNGAEIPEKSVSRKNQLLYLYKCCKNDILNYDYLCEKLNSFDNAKLRSDKYYLYFIQLGKSMYTGNPISLDNLDDYDIDHIIPQSILKDDSISNRVLVERKENMDKGDSYPLNLSIQNKMINIWNHLRKIKLIDEKKYTKLTRKEILTDDEIAGFINRQLVTTNQSIKAVCELLQIKYPNTKIVYSKASNVSEFRHQFNFIKCREINDYHHAKDAYLNIVVGNVFYQKYTIYGYNLSKKIKEYKENKESTNPIKIFYNNVPNAWDFDNCKSLGIVNRNINRNDIMITRLQLITKGRFYKQTIIGKGNLDLYPLKENCKISNLSKYGGFNSLDRAYFSLIESEDKKGNIIRTIEGIPVLFINRNLSQSEYEEIVLKKYLNLTNPKVIIPIIRKGSLFQLGNTYVRINGKTGDSIIITLSSQLNSNNKIDFYLKVINKFNKMSDEIKKNITSDMESFEVTKTEKGKIKITKESNIMLYDFYTEALHKKIYNGISIFTNYYNTLVEKRNNFILLTLLQQIEFLNEYIKILHCNAALGDLSLLIEKAKFCGKIVISKNITNKEIYLVNQSITGFFENRLKL